MERHFSVLADGDFLEGQSCEGETFKCPLCSYKAARCLVESHIRGHSFVKHGEFKILKCGLQCRDATHFHCCYCPATLINRAQLLKHLNNHQKNPDDPVVPQKHPPASLQHQAAKPKQPAAVRQHTPASSVCIVAKPAALRQHTLASSVYLVAKPTALQQLPAVILNPMALSHPPAAPSNLQQSVGHPQLPEVHPWHLPDDSQQLVSPASALPKFPCLPIQCTKTKKIVTCPNCKTKLKLKINVKIKELHEH